MKTVTVLSLILFSAVANAQARKYTNCAIEKNIIHPVGSSGIYMDQDCKKAYVLPPIVGRIKMDNYVQSISDIQCRAEMANINAINKQMAKLEDAQADLNRAYKDLEKKHTKIQKLKKQCDPMVKHDQRVTDVLSQYQQEIDLRQTTIDTLVSSYKQCQETETEDSTCENPAEEIVGLKEEITELRTDKREYDVESARSKLQLANCQTQVTNEIARIEEDDTEYQAQSEKLREAREEYLTMLNNEMKPLLKEAGGHITIGYFSEQSNLVRKFAEANKSLPNVTFSAMPIRKGIINFRRVADGLKAGLPVILQSTIFGLELPANEEGDVSPQQLLPKPTEEGSITFGEAAGGDMTINKYSACSLSEEFNGLSDKDRTAKFAAMIKPTVVFHYEVQADRSIGIKYNESHLYQLIKKSSSKRGFFRSSSSMSITEKTESEKWIQITIKSQDDRVQITDSEKVMMDIRREFLDSALMKVAKGYLTEEQLKLQDPGSDGATLAAAQLQKVPNVYAQYAAVALNIGSALFGGSSSEASMTRTVSTQQEEVLTDSKMVQEYGKQTLEASVQP